jgi:diacylglycerol kinase (ATP)
MNWGNVLKCIFVYNPNSGKGKIKKKLEYVKKTLEDKFDEVALYSTKSQEDTIRVAKEACGKYDALIFSGGDGTFNDIVCGVANEPARPVLGYIPSGTVNDIARNLKIPKNLKKALRIIIEGHKINHDIGKVNDQYFMYVVATGTFTGSSYRTKQKIKKVFGKLAYAFGGFKDFLNPLVSKIRLKLSDQVVETETPLVLVLNSISVAGIPFHKNGHLNDGKFDIVIVKKGLRRGLFNIIRLFLLGPNRLKKRKLIELYRAGSFTIETEGKPCWTVDGEEGPQGTVQIENLHHHLEIFVPN